MTQTFRTSLATSRTGHGQDSGSGGGGPQLVGGSRHASVEPGIRWRLRATQP